MKNKIKYLIFHFMSLFELNNVSIIYTSKQCQKYILHQWTVLIIHLINQ